MTEPVRHAPVAVSAPAVAHQWARQEGGPTGAAVIVDTEIAGRLRGGTEWVEEDALAVSVIARPAGLAPVAADLGWLAAGLAAREAAARLMPSIEPHCAWPDGLDGGQVSPAGRRGAPANEVVVPRWAVTVDSALGPGRVDYLIATVRLAPVSAMVPADRQIAAAIVADALRKWLATLDDPQQILDDYHRRCATVGRLVAINLLPHGSLRGRAVGVDDNGALIVASSTGLTEVVPVGGVAAVNLLAERD